MNYKIGDVVKVQHWVGIITDIAHTEQGAVMLCVNSLKAIIRNHPPEWLTVIEGQITPATIFDLQRDFETYYKRLVQMGNDLSALTLDMEIKLGSNDGQAE